MDFVDDGSVGGEVLVAGLDLGVLLEVALGSQVVGDLGGKVMQSKSQSGPRKNYVKCPISSKVS